MSDGELNLYNTDESSLMNVFGYDCLYCGPDDLLYSFSKMLIPFCIRPAEVKKQWNDEICNGRSITFKELKLNNISGDDLFHWNGVIQTIDLYEKYLRFADLVNENEIYCNCSSFQRLGKSCQYEIDVEDSEESFCDLFWDDRNNVLDSTFENTYLTCYLGLRCKTNLFCLDWRQICNGIVDCDSGEDEEGDFCLQMELNECDSEEEFRCQSGLCIPMIMRGIESEVCPDLSDGLNIFNTDRNYLFQLCFLERSLQCDEINRGWKQFSCLNGQSMFYEDLTSKITKQGKTCSNNEHWKYLTNLFSTSDENECWKSMICISGFDYLYPDVNCSNEIKIKDLCPIEYKFPPNSVVYSFVYFIYDESNRSNWLEYSGPNLICYKKGSCQNGRFNLPKIEKENLICLSIIGEGFCWNNFYEYVVELFSGCFISSIEMNCSMLYECAESKRMISMYRIKDKRRDCYLNDDEDPKRNVCSLKTNDLFQCLTNSNECVRELFIGDDESDCIDGSDEYFQGLSNGCSNRICGFRPFSRRTLPEIYRFNELCDNIVNRHLFSIESKESDETDCSYWPNESCYSYYTKCNRVWNCRNGIDEINCEYLSFNTYIEKSFHCQWDEHYCIQLDENKNINLTCIDLNRTGDGILDCIGGTDERFGSICIDKYPLEFERRFQCLNSDLCIGIDEICNRRNDCPFHDDELICPWLKQTNLSRFYCNNSFVNPVNRCEYPLSNSNCKMKENLWFCDLDDRNGRIGNIPQIPFESYPPFNENIQSILFSSSNSKESFKSKKDSLSLVNRTPDRFVCNFGYRMKSSIMKNQFYCLCSPSYYGDHCEYQSDRLTVSLRIEYRYLISGSIVFRLMIYLLNENSSIVSYDQLVYNSKIVNPDETFLVYLISSRLLNQTLHERSKSTFVRIDSYIINRTNVKYISSWLFSVSFAFLPVNRLAANLRLVNESFEVIYCRKGCGSHGKCLHYINAKEKEYCWCDQNWFGENCQLKSSSCNSRSCAPNSECILLNEEKKQIQCVCLLGQSGDECYTRSNPCENNPCENNGTCLVLDERNLGYVCVCKSDYYGIFCTIRYRYSFVSIDGNISRLSMIPAGIIIFGDPNSAQVLLQTQRALIKDIKLPTLLKIRRGAYFFGFIQLFYNYSKNVYYMISIGGQSDRILSRNTSVISDNLCPNVSEIFNETILSEYSYLKRLKLYHLPCNDNYKLRCFFDEYRMCICTQDHNTVCYFYNHQYGYCNYCKNAGLCVQQNPDLDSWNFVCLCPKCTYGSFCQFAPRKYFISFDMLIGTDMKIGQTSFTQQSTIIHLTLIFLLFLLIFSLICNTISIFILSNKKLRQVGCDLYLLNLSILSNIGLILLFLRFIYMIIIQMYIVKDLLFIQISCILLEYVVRLIPSLFDWLTVCISIERTYTIIKNVRFTRIIALKTLKLSRWIILIVFMLNILTTFHRPFYLTLYDDLDMNDEPRGHPWCVLDFGSTSWNVYEKCINVFQLVVPFILNLLSIISFIVHKTKLELTLMAKENQNRKFAVMKKQISKYKSLIISPTMVLILEIPRLILTFTLACIDHAWQRYAYLLGYFISFFPLTGVLFIYILPSPKYRKELQTIVKKRFRISLFERT